MRRMRDSASALGWLAVPLVAGAACAIWYLTSGSPNHKVAEKPPVDGNADPKRLAADHEDQNARAHHAKNDRKASHAGGWSAYDSEDGSDAPKSRAQLAQIEKGLSSYGSLAEGQCMSFEYFGLGPNHPGPAEKDWE